MAISGQLHGTSTGELMARMTAERQGTPFLVYRDLGGDQHIVDLDAALSRLSVGRHPASDLALAWDPEASRLHAELERIAGEWTVVDDGRSRNGTFVNERQIRGRTVLVDGDVFRVGSTEIVFRAPGSGGGSTTKSATRRPVELTGAQRRVLIALCRPVAHARSFASPASNRQIAEELFVSVETVRTHIRALFDALEISPVRQNQKRAALARAAIERGIVQQRDFDADATPL